MDNIIIQILAGFLIGTCGTLVGAGGGFILVPLLLLTNPELPADVVTAISMAVVAANAMSGSVAYARSKRIDYKAAIVFALFSIPGSIAGVFVVKYIPVHTFNIVFGLLLLVLSVYLFIKKQNAGHTNLLNGIKGLTHREITDNKGTIFTYSYDMKKGIIISLVVGFLSPLLGIGGGIIHVPAMVHILHFPVYIATATSHFILSIMATVSVITHYYNGSYNDPAVRMMILGLAIGIIPGAQLGAYLSHRVKTKMIIKLLAVCLAIVGLRLVIHGL